MLYALALAGGTIAYVPFIAILLPMQVDGLAGEEAGITWLAYLTFAGAVTASLAGIGAGWLSDRMKTRRPLVLAGLAASSLTLVTFVWAETFITLLALLVLWQIGLNLMLAPLMAWAGDCVPDHQKGQLGGWMALAPVAGALATTLITLPGMASPAERLWWVAGMAAVLVAPGVLLAMPRPVPELHSPAPLQTNGLATLAASFRSPALARMWAARLLMQLAQAALFAFLYFWLRSLDEGFAEDSIAQVYSIVLVASLPITLAAGRWSDHTAQPLAPLPVLAVIASAGLGVMALASSPLWAIAGYAVFALAAAVFLALHSAQTLRVLPDPARRAEHLGWFNLTNTAPALIMPWLTLAVEPAFGFAGLFAILGASTLAAAGLLAGISRHAAPEMP